jgi:Subtilase family
MILIDPYLSIALANNFADHLPGRPVNHTDAFHLVLQLQKQKLDEFVKDQNDFLDFQFNPSSLISVDDEKVALSGKFRKSAIDRLIQKDWVLHVELGHSLVPQRWNRRFAEPVAILSEKQARRPPQSKANGDGRVLAAIIDNGCNFASLQYRRPIQEDAKPKTRVVAIWDQDDSADWGKVASATPPNGFIYGLEILQEALNDMLATHQTPNGEVDERAAYNSAHRDELLGSLTHGTHTMGRFVGTSYGINGDIDHAASSDVVFVQLPRQVVQTPSANAIHRCILDGIQYIKHFAAANGYSKCIVVCAYGSYLGPHDGTSFFERALDAILNANEPDIQIVFAAGNCRKQALHVSNTTIALHGDSQTSSQAATAFEINWMLAPESECSADAEFWITNHEEPVDVTIQSGTEKIAVTFKSGQVTRVFDWLFVHCQHFDGSDDTSSKQMCLTFRAAPTKGDGGLRILAPSGAVHIAFTSSFKKGGTIDGYLCWGGENFGFEKRMSQSHWAARENSALIIQPQGTIIGSACGSSQKIHLVGGYTRGDYSKATDYSSIGPARGGLRGPNGSKRGPDLVAVSDLGFFNNGIPGPGVESGAVYQLWGTSGAAPQLGRAILNFEISSDPIPLDRLQSGKNSSSEEIGVGFLNF